jgi:hypothetical protein
MIYKDIVHKTFTEKIKFEKYIKSKNDTVDFINRSMRMDNWLDWLQERNKDLEYEWELEENYD